LKSGGVVKAGVGEIEVLTNADGTCVWMVAAEDGIAIVIRRLGQTEAQRIGEQEGGGIAGEATAGEHVRLV